MRRLRGAVSNMRNRTDIEKDIEPVSEDDEGNLYHHYADGEELQQLTLEVLLDIRDFLQRPYQ